MISRSYNDLLATSLLTLLLVGLALSGVATGVPGGVVAVPLVLLLPGYALAAAAFPGRLPGLAERLLLTAGLSLTVAVLGGLVLYWLSIPITAPAWALLLGALTLLGCGVAWARRRHLAEPTRPAPVPQLGILLRRGLPLGLALLLVLAAAWIVRDGPIEARTADFTQLWLVPGAAASQVQLGVSNHETTTLRYRLELVAQGTLLQSWPAIVVDPGQRWQAVVTVAPTATALEARLYRLDTPESLYRRVMLR